MTKYILTVDKYSAREEHYSSTSIMFGDRDQALQAGRNMKEADDVVRISVMDNQTGTVLFFWVTIKVD